MWIGSDKLDRSLFVIPPARLAGYIELCWSPQRGVHWCRRWYHLFQGFCLLERYDSLWVEHLEIVGKQQFFKKISAAAAAAAVGVVVVVVPVVVVVVVV